MRSNAFGSSIPPCSSMLSRARWRSCSTPHCELATPITGMSRRSRFVIEYSAGKIFLYARSPVAPKKTNASDRSSMSARPLLAVAAELLAHGGEDLVGEEALAARREALIEGGGEHVRRHALVDGG